VLVMRDTLSTCSPTIATLTRYYTRSRPLSGVFGCHPR
jgi:hypothetical protein